MPIRTVVDCPRCGREDKVEGNAGLVTLDSQYGWKEVFGKLLCPDCVKSVADFIAMKARPKADAGFTDGRPAKRGV